MARPKKELDVEALLADWKTGRYQGRAGVDALAKKYGIGKDKVYAIVRDVEQVNRQLTDKIVLVNQNLNELSDKEYFSVVKHADRETRLKIRRDRIVEKAFDAIEEKFDYGELTPYDIKTLVEASDKNCVTAEIAPRFSNNGVTVNATAQAATIEQRKITFEVIGAGHNQAD